ncbi:MAG: NADH-quinone oxidoreductase subunit N, partial [Alphaproteobacteria bacterium]
MAPLLDLVPALPELILAISAMALLMVGVFRGEGSSAMVTRAAVAALVVAALVTIWVPGGPRLTFGGSFVFDSFARFMKVLCFLG